MSSLPSILFVIQSDPRTSAKPAEAIRIAAGVGTWRKVALQVYLRGAAILALAEYVDELVDEDNYNSYLPVLGEFAGSIYVQKNSSFLAEIGEPSLPFQEVSDEEVAHLAAKSRYLVNF